MLFPPPFHFIHRTSPNQREAGHNHFPKRGTSRDNATGTGDYELVYNIRRELPKALCKNPLAIEVQTLKGIPASQTGQKFAWNDPLNGFACIHDDQGKRGLCHDYKV
ncbi:hypothetical protein E2320_006138, partial [Naja naja]